MFVNVLSYFSCPPALLPPGDLSQAPKRGAGAPGGRRRGRAAPRKGGAGAKGPCLPLSFGWPMASQTPPPPRASQRPPCRQGSRLHDAPFRLPFPGCQERCCSVCAGGGGVLQGPKAPVLWALCAPAAPRGWLAGSQASRAALQKARGLPPVNRRWPPPVGVWGRERRRLSLGPGLCGRRSGDTGFPPGR